MSSMKILQVGKYYSPYKGGIETYLENLCLSLRQRANLSVVVANHGKNAGTEVSDTVRGVHVQRVSTPIHFASAPICPSLNRHINKDGFDIVHVHVPNPTAIMAWLTSKRRGRLVVSYHSDTVRQRVLGAMFEPFQQMFLRQAHAIIAASPDYLRSSQTLAPHLDRCHVIPYGIPMSQSTVRREEVEQIRSQYGSDLLIAVGRLVYYKGFEYLIRAMASVPKGRLLLIGDGPERETLQRIAYSCGVANRVVFLGSVPDTAPYYSASTLFVLPSVARSEAFGIVQIEAMAAGLPVINTGLDSGVPFVSLHGKTGLTVPPKDSASLAGAINLLLADEKLRTTYGLAARIRALEEFTVERMTERTLSLYEQVLGRAPVKARAHSTS